MVMTRKTQARPARKRVEGNVALAIMLVNILLAGYARMGAAVAMLLVIKPILQLWRMKAATVYMLAEMQLYRLS